MFSSYHNDNYKILPKYSPQVLIGNWYEERFHYNRDNPEPEEIYKDGFRKYGTNKGVVITPHKEVGSLKSTIRTSSAINFKEMDKQPDLEAMFKEKQNALRARKMSQEQMFKKYNLLNGSNRTTYTQDYNRMTCRPGWMKEAGITNEYDRLGDISTRQNQSHLATYLTPIDAPRLVAM